PNRVLPLLDGAGRYPRRPTAAGRLLTRQQKPAAHRDRGAGAVTRRRRAPVKRLLGRAEKAGATLTGKPPDHPQGINSGSFRDLDGHLWEIMWNPQLDT